MAKVNKVLVYCPNYNGFQAMFMMAADDFRIRTDADALRYGYEVLDTAPAYSHKEKMLTTKHGVFSVASDHSLKAMDAQSKALRDALARRTPA